MGAETSLVAQFALLRLPLRFIARMFTEQMNSGVTGGATIMALLMAAGVWWIIRRIRNWLGF